MFQPFLLLNFYNMQLDTYKIRILNIINTKDLVNLKKIKYIMSSNTAKGGKANAKETTEHFNWLAERNTIIDNGGILSLSDEGVRLLEENKHLLAKAKPKPYTRKDKGKPSKGDIALYNFLARESMRENFKCFQLKLVAYELGVTIQSVSRKIIRLKKFGFIDYEPNKYKTIKII